MLDIYKQNAEQDGMLRAARHEAKAAKYGRWADAVARSVFGVLPFGPLDYCVLMEWYHNHRVRRLKPTEADRRRNTR